MSFPRYPKYKASGLEWLGEIPEHWEPSPLRSTARSEPNSFTDGDWIETPFITDDGVRLLQTGNIGVGLYKEQGFRFISEQSFDALRCTEVEPGDVLICRLAEPVGRACVAPALGVRMITSVDVCILKTSQHVFPGFLVHLMSSAQYLGFMEGHCRGGTRDRVSRSFLARVRVSLPPLPEQRAIAAFLDRETAKIDGLVAEQQRLIELLKEKRQAVISHAVTKGLDPKAPMKPSGVEWLGDVPAHWEVKPIKRLSPVLRGASPRPIDDPKYFDDSGEYSWVRIADVSASDGELRETPQRLSELGSSLSVRLEPGQLFVSIAGTVGKPCITRIRACIHDGFVYFPRLALEPHWLHRIFAAGQCYGGLGKLGTQLNLNTDTIGGIRVPVPPVPERGAIAAFLDRETAKFDGLVKEAESAITLLQERRSALISAAVTGQIDVRNAVATEAA